MNILEVSQSINLARDSDKSNYIKRMSIDYHDKLAGIRIGGIVKELMTSFESGKFSDCVEKYLEYSNTPFSNDQKENIARVLYESSKYFQFHPYHKIPCALDLFLITSRLTSNQSLKEMISSRLPLMRVRVNQVETNQIIKEIKNRLLIDNPENKPIEVLRRKRPDLFEQAKLSLSIANVDFIHSIGVYRWRGDENASQILSKFIREFKDGDELFVAFLLFLVEQYIEENTDIIDRIDSIVPVPADIIRETDRQHDLASEIAKKISRWFAIPLEKPLERITGGIKSRHCSYSELKKQFSLNKKRSIHLSGKKILLVDDVVTRGYTMEVCASLLKDAGTQSISGFCIARAESTLKSKSALSGIIL